MIQLKNLSREFQVGNQVVHALDNIDLEIAEKDYVSIMGVSGCGKTTLLNILGLLDTPSSGDYILSGGESASFVVIDAVLRLLPGILGNEKSKNDESFENGLLEYPQYTKPQIWEKKSVPDVLLSGDHAKIKDWRLVQSEDITRRRRPDLWEKYKKNK